MFLWKNVETYPIILLSGAKTSSKAIQKAKRKKFTIQNVIKSVFILINSIFYNLGLQTAFSLQVNFEEILCNCQLSCSLPTKYAIWGHNSLIPSSSPSSAEINDRNYMNIFWTKESFTVIEHFFFHMYMHQTFSSSLQNSMKSLAKTKQTKK